MEELRPLMGCFEDKFQKDALAILQKALISSGINIIVAEHPAIMEAMSQIGMLYHEQVPNDF